MSQDKDAAERNFTHINHCFSTGISKIEIVMTSALTWSDSQPGHTLTIVSYNCRDSFGVSAISPGKPFCLSCVNEGTGETLKLLPHFVVFYDLLQYRSKAKWNVLYTIKRAKYW